MSELVLTEEQELLRKTAADFVRQSSPVSRVRQLRDADDPLGFSPALWREMCALGWPGIVLPEEYGGLGLGYADLVVVLEELGTALAPGELVSAVLIPPLPDGLKGLYMKFTSGSSEERPCAGIAAFIRTENGICRELRLAVGAVSAQPVRINSAEERARNQPLTTELMQAIADESARGVRPIDDIRGPADYKRHLVGVLAGRALTALAVGESEIHT